MGKIENPILILRALIVTEDKIDEIVSRSDKVAGEKEKELSIGLFESVIKLPGFWCLVFK